MPESLDIVLASQLDPGERLLWAGQPRAGIRLRGQDVVQIPFSLFWCGFVFFWEFMALTAARKAPGSIGIVFPLFGLPFVAIGLYLLFGRFLTDARGWERTYYGVTNERIVIVSGLFSRQIKSLPLRTLTEVSLTESRDDSGSISFGPTNMMNNSGGSWRSTGRYSPPSFDLIEHAKDVYDVIRKAQRAASGVA